MFITNFNKRIFGFFAFLLFAFPILSFAGEIVAPIDRTADVVLGQPSFESKTKNYGGLSASSLAHPTNVFLDNAGRLWVVDRNNSRVLMYNDPVNTDHVADLVLGQPNFTSNTENNGGVKDSTLSYPASVCVDNAGNVWVADGNNNRVLMYIDPVNTDTVADSVLGHPDFTSSWSWPLSDTERIDYPSSVFVDDAKRVWVASRYYNKIIMFNDPVSTDTAADLVIGQDDFSWNWTAPTLSAQSLSSPTGIFVDNTSRVWVADEGNNRVLMFFDPVTTDTTADMVLGQPGLVSNNSNNGQDDPDTEGLSYPASVYVDNSGNVWVADENNNRVLKYIDPVSTDATADFVYGQPDFFTREGNYGGIGPSSLASPSGIYGNNSGDIWIADQYNNRVLFIKAKTSTNPFSNDLNNVKIYPNPFKPTDGDVETGIEYDGTPGSGIYMTNLIPESEMTVFNLQGQKVFYIKTPASAGTIHWDGKDSSGRKLPSGTYLVLFKKDVSFRQKCVKWASFKRYHGLF